MNGNYKISGILPANDTILLNDAYIILLYAMKIPPHLLVSINGKTFTLSAKGASIDGELSSLLKLIRKKNIETIFIRLSLPPVFTMQKLNEEIRNSMLAYQRADIGVATCLTPIRDFCHSIYKTDSHSVNLIFDLLPKLQEKNALNGCYHLNMEKQLSDNSLLLNRYGMNEVNEAIHRASLLPV
ncbi:MAG TPA: hypothetical protein VII99_00370 [Bacteroidia bacterium]